MSARRSAGLSNMLIAGEQLAAIRYARQDSKQCEHVQSLTGNPRIAGEQLAAIHVIPDSEQGTQVNQ